MLEFDQNGLLPIGIHLTTMDEFERRFAVNLVREKLLLKLKELISVLKKFNCQAIFIDGSYVTNKSLPSDIDLCWEDEGLDYAFVELMAPVLWEGQEELKRQFGMNIFPAHMTDSDSKKMFIDFFQQDSRTGLQKGIIRIEIDKL